MGDGENRQIQERFDRLELMLRANSDLLADLVERVGGTFAKQAYSVKDLAVRWNCGETFVRKIIAKHKLTLLKGSDKKFRRPIAVLRSSVLEYEKGLAPIDATPRKRATKAPPSWVDSPFLPKPELQTSFGKGVRRLGEISCEPAKVKSRVRRNA